MLGIILNGFKISAMKWVATERPKMDRIAPGLSRDLLNAIFSYPINQHTYPDVF